jgi:phage terminase Nu1 subunit (DNA packaging protein)
MNAVNQAEFARLQGWSKSYVTKLKGEGRLVMSPDGLVDVAATRAKIAATADPNRDDVVQRHAAGRGQVTPPPPPEADRIGSSYQAARAVKEKFAAMTAKLDYERAVGKVVEKTDVSAAVEDVTSVIRQALENLPHRAGPDLVGKDLDAIRATLKQEVHAALAEMEREFARRIKQLGQEETA